MPVVRIRLDRFGRMVGASRRTIMGRLPFVGLDIEGTGRNFVRVEYSPNRPDFGTDIGIARALKGLLGKESGMPRYAASDSGITMNVDPHLSRVRPYIACATATGLNLDDEDVRQMVSLQEDLHNGLGRMRRKAAVGLHDLDAIVPPFFYGTAEPSFRFRPLGGKNDSSLREILTRSKEGKAYGKALAHGPPYPVITDSEGTVLSFPPIVNGARTKVTRRTRNLFIEVTGTDLKATEDVIAVMATTLAEAGARLGTVRVGQSGQGRVTPDLSPRSLRLDVPLVNSLLGLDLSKQEISECLARSRLEVREGRVLGPRYRVDLMHPVDVVEEVALGYGIDKLGPLYPASTMPGSFNEFEAFLDAFSTLMAGSGMVEMMTFELVDEATVYSKFGRDSSQKVSVHDPRSMEHSLLRDALIPNLAAALSANVKSDYPQRVYEIGRVYARTGSGLSESWHLGCIIAHSTASFTEAKSFAEAAVRTAVGKEVETKPAPYWAFAGGRSASVVMDGRTIGFVGELKAESLAACGLGVPASGFEVDLSALHKAASLNRSPD